MKTKFLLQILTTTFFGLLVLVLFSCNKEDLSGIDFRQEMRDFVVDLSDYARTYNQNFIIVPQNGQEIITDNGDADGIIQTNYIQNINAVGREDLFYGYSADDKPTPDDAKAHMLGLLNICEQNNIKVLVIDYCSSAQNMDDSYSQNFSLNFISFAANERNLTNIPNYPIQPYNQNNDDILNISQAKNFLYLINTEDFTTKKDFIDAVKLTNYDVVIMDLFHNEDEFTADEINELKTKQNGGKRLIICYISIAEAEDYRYYWNLEWNKDEPDWLGDENPSWKGNYKVKYWETGWQNIIFGNDNSYMKKIIDKNFDGAYLDIIDAFDYFENL
ncbi:MAG: endo alpha-1,4 polygalactosaminidase [Bacteroidales bacterium]|nr:endo alpha-1,4 polygalactosaminidase [Bacteroidales bacterium]